VAGKWLVSGRLGSTSRIAGKFFYTLAALTISYIFIIVPQRSLLRQTMTMPTKTEQSNMTMDSGAPSAFIAGGGTRRMVWRRMKGGTMTRRRGAGRRDPAATPSSSWAQRWAISINATRVRRRWWRRRRRSPSSYDVGLVMEGGGRRRRCGSNCRRGGQGQSSGHANLASLRRKQCPTRDLCVSLLRQRRRVPCLRCWEALR
jgi:hypothetical protein